MNKIKYLLMLSVAFVTFSLTSCDDDDEYFDSKYQSREIVINKIYLEDYESSVPDREVTFARLGQMIRVEGSGLYGMKQVLVNGYDTYFNRTYVTDNSMLITLNSNTPISDAEPEERNIIRFIKDKTQTSYEFDIRTALPTITGFSNSLPMAGEEVIVYGTNLHETYSIILPGNVSVEVEASDDKDGEWYSFIMPDGLTEGGSILSEGPNGSAKTPPCFNFSQCMIIDFDGTGNIGGWSATYGWLNYEDGSGGEILMSDYEDDPLGTGRGLCCPFIPRRVAEGDGVAPNVAPTGWFTAGNGYDSEDWTRMYDYIDPETPVNKVAFQFDLYCPDGWDHGQLEFTLQNNLSTYGYGSTETKNTTNIEHPTAVTWIPWFIDESEVVPYKSPSDQWETITIPLSSFGKYQNTDENTGSYTYKFQDVVDERNSASYKNFGMFLVNYDISLGSEEDPIVFETETFNQMIYTDNWRIVPYEFYTVSDYPEDDDEE